MSNPPVHDSAPSSPSSAKKSQPEVSEGDAGAAGGDGGGRAYNSRNNGDSALPSVGYSGATSQHNSSAGGQPVKAQHLPTTAEHLRYGHVDFEEVEESEEDKRRHYLIRKPKVKQWFYKGKLFRSAEGRASARIEL